MSQAPEVTGIKYLQGSQSFSAVMEIFKKRKTHRLGRDFFSLLVFRKSSIFLQHFKGVNNQEHDAGRTGNGPENMGVRQGMFRCRQGLRKVMEASQSEMDEEQ